MSSAPAADVSAAGPDPRAEHLAELGQSFRHAYRRLRGLRGRDTHLLPGKISHAQYELLSEIYERGPLAACELAAAAGLSPAAVSQMLDHLAVEGHVERVRSETDRRIVTTKLTRRGRRQIEARRKLWSSRWEEALAGVDDEELRIAATVLERVGTVFDDPPG